jgi:hypothetical protein
MSQPSCRLTPGPLEQFADGFLAELSASGYSPRTCEAQLGLMRHLSRWLGARALAAGDLTASVIDQFAAERHVKHVQLRSPRGLTPLLSYLRAQGAAPAAEPLSPARPGETLLDRFGQYLSGERGLAAGHLREAAWCAGPRKWAWSQMWSHSPPSGTVHRRPPRLCSRRSRTVAAIGERRSALLESVLGATPQEFESPILRRADLRRRACIMFARCATSHSVCLIFCLSLSPGHMPFSEQIGMVAR